MANQAESEAPTDYVQLVGKKRELIKVLAQAADAFLAEYNAGQFGSDAGFCIAHAANDILGHAAAFDIEATHYDPEWGC